MAALFALLFLVLLIPDILDHPAYWGESRRLFKVQMGWLKGFRREALKHKGYDFGSGYDEKE